MAADLGEGDLDRPATDEPAQNVERVGIEIGAEKGLRLEFALRVTHQDIADGNPAAGVVPYGGGGDDLEHPFAPAISSVTSRRRFLLGLTRRCFSVGCRLPTTGGRPALPGTRFGAGLCSAASSRRRVIMVSHGRTSLSRSMAAKLASPTPMMRRCGSQSAAWIKTCLPQSVSFLCWRLPGLCSCQYRSEGARTVRNGKAQQRPAQGIFRQQHEREPAQAARLDEVAMRRAHRISIDATNLDPRSPSPFYGIVEADHHRIVVANEGIDEQAEQAAREPRLEPYVPVEHAVIVGKMRDLIEPQ